MTAKARITSYLEVEYDSATMRVTAPAKYAGKFVVQTPRGPRLA